MRRLFLRGGGENNKDFVLIRLFNANDLIGLVGSINQSNSVCLHRCLCRDFFKEVVGKKIRILC